MEMGEGIAFHLWFPISGTDEPDSYPPDVLVRQKEGETDRHGISNLSSLFLRNKGGGFSSALMAFEPLAAGHALGGQSRSLLRRR